MLAILVFFVCASGSFGRPIKLLVPDESENSGGRRLVATEEGLALLRNNYSDVPVAIVTLIGKARSGKSFGLNNLLGTPHSDGFQVGHTFKPETSGALLWPHPFPRNLQDCKFKICENVVLLLDTEGLSAGAQLFDKALLAAASAISSRLIYHTTGYVYTEDVLRLHGLACLVEDYARRGILSSSLLPKVRQYFFAKTPTNAKITWIVNKNDLAKNFEGATDAETLFSVALAERANPANDPEIAQFNATVRVVKTAFSDHVVHLVPSAAPPGVECSELTNFALENLSSGYVRAIEILRAEIAAETPRRGVANSAEFMTGRDIADLLEAVLPAANEGSGAFSDRMADAIVRRHTDEVKSELSECVANLLYPMEESELEEIMDALVARELNRYREGPARDEKLNFAGGKTNFASGALSPLLARNERELEEKFFAERLRAKLLNSERSENACSTAARAAAARFSREALTSGGARSLDLKTFDVAVAVARDKYLESAVGPRKQYHADRLDELARAERETVIAETAPARRKAWLVGAGIAVVMMQTAKVPLILQNIFR